MHDIYWFDSSHDLALASNSPSYMPPAMVRKMSEDLALLPVWYAPASSRVLAASAYNSAFLVEMGEKFIGLPELVTWAELPEMGEAHFHPWGWNRFVCHRLLQHGAAEACLPNDCTLQQWRELSHRGTAVELLSRLSKGDSLCGESIRLQTLDDCRSWVEGREATLLKAPYSGSGKGLNWCNGIFDSHVEGWCRRLLQTQGSVIGEPVYQKVIDFAMEFKAGDDGKVSFIGYSLFLTGKSGAYMGNVLMNDRDIEKVLNQYVSPDCLIGLREEITSELSDLLGGVYHGCLGVDMMVVMSDGGRFKVHPCVEINLRLNMGIVSHELVSRYVPEGSVGIFTIDFCSKSEHLMELHRCLSNKLEWRQECSGRISRGYLPLVPVSKQHQFSARMLVVPYDEINRLNELSRELRLGWEDFHFHSGRLL